MSGDLKFRISEVATLTGVPTDSIRAWEKRYRAVMPTRDAGNVRRYSELDVTRLRCMKRLVDRGVRISDVATLDEPALRRRIERQEALHTTGLSQAIPLAVFGEGLAAMFRAMPGEDFRVVAEIEDIGQWSDAHVPADATVVIGYEVAEHERLKRLVQGLFSAGPRLILLLYRFAPSELVEEFRRRGVITMRATADASELRHALLSRHYWDFAERSEAQQFLNQPVPEPRLSDADLDRARQMSAVLACECPSHLAELIGALRSFESYSAQCQAMTPKDAATHAMLKSASGHARAIMESALVALARDDGFLDRLFGGESNPA